MYQFYSSKHLVFTILILFNLIGHITLSKNVFSLRNIYLLLIFLLATVPDKPKLSDDKDNVEPIAVSLNLNQISFIIIVDFTSQNLFHPKHKFIYMSMMFLFQMTMIINKQFKINIPKQNLLKISMN
jgi:hypothetical protein